MKCIIKRNEPRSLVQHRSKENASYDNIPTDAKEDIRKFLLEEQGHICCYCMKRIKIYDMKIEHWKPQKPYQELALDYKNMLGACNGNEGSPRHLQCCDTRKGNNMVTVNPLSSNYEALIRYSEDGRIFSEDATINYELDAVLNLNFQNIVNNRKSVIDAVIQYLKNKYPSRQWKKTIIQREIDKWNHSDSEGKYKEYCQVALSRLHKIYRKSY